MIKTHLILYVKDQKRSRDFYRDVLQLEVVLDVPGMTEFQLSTDTKLGLMPESGIQKILQDIVPNPALGSGIPRCEIYLYVDDPTTYFQRAIESGAIQIQEETPREWGDSVTYCADLDGHILAFAKRSE